MSSEDADLRHHLLYNHFPPLGIEFLPAARQAIAMAREEEWEEEIDTPQGEMSVEDVVEMCNLHDFLTEEA